MCCNLRDALPFMSPVPQLLQHPSVQVQSRPFNCQCLVPRQGLQDSRHAAPVWSEMMMSADQSPEATAALPRGAVPLCSQHPMSWFQHRGIEEGIGDS